ncbi:hypothetical protein BC629DRAFT_1594919 [Irpex lacteus]|nr:hypothetical protein BC629DRAFT_1594919 [Irpex lacteus]
MALRVSSLFTTHTQHPLSSIDELMTQKNMAQVPPTRNDSPPRFAPLTRQLSGLGAKLGNVFGGASGGSAKDDQSSIAVSDSDTLAGGSHAALDTLLWPGNAGHRAIGVADALFLDVWRILPPIRPPSASQRLPSPLLALHGPLIDISFAIRAISCPSHLSLAPHHTASSGEA